MSNRLLVASCGVGLLLGVLLGHQAGLFWPTGWGNQGRPPRAATAAQDESARSPGALSEGTSDGEGGVETIALESAESLYARLSASLEARAVRIPLQSDRDRLELRRWLLLAPPAGRLALLRCVLAGGRSCNPADDGTMECRLADEWILEDLVPILAAVEPAKTLELLVGGPPELCPGLDVFECLLPAWAADSGVAAFEAGFQAMGRAKNAKVRLYLAAGLEAALGSTMFEADWAYRRTAFQRLLDTWPDEQRWHRLDVMGDFLAQVSQHGDDLATAFAAMEQRLDTPEEKSDFLERTAMAAERSKDLALARATYFRQVQADPSADPELYILTVDAQDPDLALRYARELLHPENRSAALAALLWHRAQTFGGTVAGTWAQQNLSTEEWKAAVDWFEAHRGGPSR